MRIDHIKIHQTTGDIPTITLTPDKILGAAIVIHGYGGSKEEQLGLAYRVSEIGLKTFVVDLRGHGENSQMLTINAFNDINELAESSSVYGKVTVIGHSLGGRLALISSANAAIGVSPAINRQFGETTLKKLATFRNYRVQQDSLNTLNQMLRDLPQPDLTHANKKYVLYGTRDIPEIYNACRNLPQAYEIPDALHSDIFTLQSTLVAVCHLIQMIYSTELKG